MIFLYVIVQTEFSCMARIAFRDTLSQQRVSANSGTFFVARCVTKKVSLDDFPQHFLQSVQQNAANNVVT